ncbi:MAG TPA: winged helix-turn-helix domain-containing protein [Terracidiphilus sp.]|nr:winged helix-turn-helix domain-containing protein [Terracidiphilus sp.]
METLKLFQFPKKDPTPEEPAARDDLYVFGPFQLDITQHALARSGTILAMPPKCFDLLCMLVRSNGDVLDKDHLMRALWPGTFVEEANLSNLIALLRKTLGDSPGRSEFIQTIPKVGYRFAAQVRAARRAADQPEIAPPAHPGPGIRIIVFPFRSDSGVTERENLGFSLPEAISSSLAELNAFVVRSMQLALGFDPLKWDPRRVAREAGVDYILAGTIATKDRGLRVSAQLIEAVQGTVVWSQRWDVDPVELMNVHQAVVHVVVRSLVRGAGDKSLSALQVGIPRTAESYDAYLLANQLSLKRTPENMALARDLYIACLEKDSSFAPAWARLGRCYRILEKFGGSNAVQSSQSAFQRAFALNPDLVLAHSLYTPIQADLGDALPATIRLLHSLESHPNSPELYAALVHACRYCGLLDASLAAHRRAIELDPNVRTSVAHTYFALLDFERALFWYGTREGLYLDALALACSGRKQEAASLLWTRRDRFASMPSAMRSLEAYLKDDPAGGIEILRTAESTEILEPEIRFYLARQAAKFGEPDLANRLLSQSIESGYWSPHALQHDPWLDSLRTTERFNRLRETAERRQEEACAAFLEAGGERLLCMPTDNVHSLMR